MPGGATYPRTRPRRGKLTGRRPDLRRWHGGFLLDLRAPTGRYFAGCPTYRTTCAITGADGSREDGAPGAARDPAQAGIRTWHARPEAGRRPAHRTRARGAAGFPADRSRQWQGERRQPAGRPASSAHLIVTEPRAAASDRSGSASVLRSHGRLDGAMAEVEALLALPRSTLRCPP